MTEIIRALFGTLFLARLDATGFYYIGGSSANFWRSFLAAILVLPFFLALIAIRFETVAPNSNILRYYGLGLSAYAISWLAFPLLMNKLSYSIGKAENFKKFIVAYNWSMVLQNVIYALVILANYVGAISNNFTNILILFVFMWTFSFTWYVAREGLSISGLTAVGVVMIDFLLSLLIEATITSRH